MKLSEVCSYVTECSILIGFSILRITQTKRKCHEVILKLVLTHTCVSSQMNGVAGRRATVGQQQ